MTHHHRADILIVGAGLGGCAAALAALDAGRRVILTDETDWIGGQLTSQAVPPDEHGWIERFGCTAAYRRFRDGVRAYYRDKYPIASAKTADAFLNPGGGWVSPLCHEPRVALAVMETLLAPYFHSSQLCLLLQHIPVAAQVAGDVVESVTLEDTVTGTRRTTEAAFFLDGTELGDLLPLCGVEHVTGAESQQETGEPHAATCPMPENVQAFSMCFAVEHREGECHVLDRPDQYAMWHDYVPQLTPPWPGKLFSWEGCNPRTLEPVRYSFAPHSETGAAFSGLWTYRRILARDHFTAGAFDSDVCLVNWPMNDYLRGDLTCASRVERCRMIDEAKQQSLALLYWLQTEAPRPDGGSGFPGLRLRPDITATRDGLAKHPYIRESRRIKAEFTVCEQHVSAALRPKHVTAEPFDDSVGIGYYRIDLHPTTGGDNYLDVAALPFQIPLGAIIPCRVENLLPAAKNLGATHITGGCYRVHPVEWNVGEAAGALAAFCLDRHLRPRFVCHHARHREDFQKRLMARGVELAWPATFELSEGDPHRHAS